MPDRGTQIPLRVRPKTVYTIVLCKGTFTLARDGVCGCGQKLPWLVTP